VGNDRVAGGVRSGTRLRLAAVTSHPVQYQAPLFQRLSREDGLELSVYYGHDASVIGEPDPEFGVPVAWDRPLLEGYQSTFLTERRQRLPRWRRMLREAGVIRHLRRGRHDAVLIHSYATWLSLMAYVGAWISRTPILLRTESQDIWKRPAVRTALKQVVLRVLFGGTRAFLVIGEANRRFYAGFGVPPERMFWTPYGIDGAFLAAERARLLPQREAIRAELGIAPEAVVVVYSGKLIERKRVEDLLRATRRLPGRNVRLLIIGDGPCRRRLSDCSRRLGLDAVFVGFQNQTQLPRFYVCGDVFVLPSRHETWGLVVNEAMSFGMPVLATSAVGAGADLIVPGVTGFSFSVGDDAALAAHLDALIVDRDRRTAMGAAARDLVARYSYQECTAGIMSALGRAVEGRCVRPAANPVVHTGG
jgi:glycosyltransferase involved in cell wall biosynthesis